MLVSLFIANLVRLKQMAGSRQRDMRRKDDGRGNAIRRRHGRQGVGCWRRMGACQPANRAVMDKTTKSI